MPVSVWYRLLFALTGLLAGETLLFFRTQQQPLRLAYMLAAVLGWAVAGLPVALLLRTDRTACMAWPAIVVVGGALGPITLLATAIAFGGWASISIPGILRDSEDVLVNASLVSLTSVATYSGLVRAFAGGGRNRDQAAGGRAGTIQR